MPSYFNPRSPCGERRGQLSVYKYFYEFQPTLPVRGATDRQEGPHPCRQISTHAPRAGSDYTTTRSCLTSTYFNPRSPCGERLIGADGTCKVERFQPTLPVRGATRLRRRSVRHRRISTHAPRAGSDVALHMTKSTDVFQPTLPVRGATQATGQDLIVYGFQPTLPVRGATRL